MPVFPSQDLYGKKICETYQQILQIYSGSVLNGAGSQQQFLNVTASYVIHAQTGSGTPLYTGSTYPITASWALNCLTKVGAGESVTGSFCSSSVWTFNHNLGNKYVVIQTYDQSDNQIIPQVVNLYDENTAIIAFSGVECGIAIASLGGLNIVSQSYNLITGSTYPITSSWAEHTITSSYIQVTGVSYPVRRINNNYTAVRTTDYTILCDATSGSFDVKLPNPSGNTNIYNIKKIDRTGHCVNVMVTNASYIDYDVTQSICHRGTNMTIQSDGTNQYWIL